MRYNKSIIYAKYDRQQSRTTAVLIRDKNILNFEILIQRYGDVGEPMRHIAAIVKIVFNYFKSSFRPLTIIKFLTIKSAFKGLI